MKPAPLTRTTENVPQATIRRSIRNPGSPAPAERFQTSGPVVFDYLRSVDGTLDVVKRVKAWILDEYRMEPVT